MVPKDQEEVLTDSFLKETADGGYRVDWDDVPEAKFEVYPKGTYDVTVAEIEYKLSMASGLPMWAMQLEITDGEYAGKKLFNNMSFSPKALPYTKRTLAKIAPQLLTSDFDPESEDCLGVLRGMQLRAKVKITKNEQTGDDQNSISELLPAQNMFAG